MTFKDMQAAAESGKRVAVTMRPRGDRGEMKLRFYIVMGWPGFNSPANNRDGYATAELALAASLRYGLKRGSAL